jgi:hypothetical protein
MSNNIRLSSTSSARAFLILELGVFQTFMNGARIAVALVPTISFLPMRPQDFLAILFKLPFTSR